MDEIIKNKILEEIEKSGFPLELEIIEQLRSNRILTFPNISFQDKNSLIHEIDILAIIFDENSEWEKGPSGIQLIVECKKTDKYPWVFFEEGYNPLNLMGRLFNADYSTDFIFNNAKFNPLIGSMNSELSKHHFNHSEIPKVRTHFEAFKKPNEQTTIYKAITNIFFGRQFLKEWFDSSYKKDEKKGRTFLNHYLIILDGPLLIATKNKKSFEVDEVNHINLLTFDTQENTHSKLLDNEITIDVIKKEYFSTYLKLLKTDVKLFNKHLVSLNL